MILRSWKATGRLDVDLDLLVEALELAGRSPDEIAAAVSGPSLPSVVAAALRLDPPRAARVLDGMWAAYQDRADDEAVTVLAGGSLLARMLDPPAAAAWSARLRQRGLEALCPLQAAVSDPTVPPRRRREAASELATRFGERAAGPRDCVAPQVSWKNRPDGNPELSLVLLAQGGAERVLGCLEALAPTLPSDLAFEVIAVDTGSTDATPMILGSLDGDVAVVRTDLDVGTVRARNLGLAEAGGQIVIFMDSAARPQPGWLEALLAAMHADADIGAAGPVLSGPDGTVLSAGASVDPCREQPVPAAGLARRPWGSTASGPHVEWLHQRRPPRPLHDRPDPVDALAGHVLAVRRTDLEEAGGFDEGYWEGGETVDLCFSLAASDRSVVCVPDSRVSLSQAWLHGADPWSAPTPDGRLAEAAGTRLQYEMNRRRFADRWGRPA